MVKVRHQGHVTEGISSDFSLSGIQIRLCEPMYRDTDLNVDIHMPHHDLSQYSTQEPLQLQGRVA
ncbi:hypothetical protein [Kaarinaea lacus]